MTDSGLLLGFGALGVVLHRAATGKYDQELVAAKEDWPLVANAQRAALVAAHGTVGTMSYDIRAKLPRMSATAADGVLAYWRARVEKYNPGDFFLPAPENRPYTDLHRGVRAALIMSAWSQAGLLPSDVTGDERFADFGNHELSLASVESFWQGVHSCSTSLAAVEAYSPSAWRLAGESLGEAAGEFAGSAVEFIAKAGAAVGRTAAALVMSDPLFLVGAYLVGRHYYRKVTE